MKMMKAIISLIIVMFCFQSLYSQVYKLKATGFSMKYEIDEYTWSEWAEWEESNVLCTIDVQKDRISIYSKETQVYDVIEKEEEIIDEEGDWTLPFICIDKDGGRCRIRLMKRADDDQLQLYVDYNDMKWVYDVYSLDD
jgi:hypothetical protein